LIPRRRPYIYSGELADIDHWKHVNMKNNVNIVDMWEKTIASYVRMPYTTAVSSGRFGMTLILKYLNIGLNDEVIIPAYTLKDLIPLIKNMGAQVVPADVDLKTFNISPETIMRRITAKTKAILVLHAFGSPCSIKSIVSLAEQYGIPVIEDCAHSLGALIQHKQTGSFGYASFFSFETTKPVNTFGGGMVTTKDAGLSKFIHSKISNSIIDVSSVMKKIKAIRMERFLFATGLGFPFLYLLATPSWKQKMNTLYRKFQQASQENTKYLPIQASIGLKKLSSLKKRIALRKEKVSLLKSLLDPCIRIQSVEKGYKATWYFCVAILPCKASIVRKKMLLHGIDAGIEDEIADNCATILGYNDCPNVDSIFSRAIALPMYEDISEQAIQKVARVLNKIIR